MAYANAVLSGEQDTPTNIMSLFITHDETNGSWPVFEYYLNKFNINYGISKKDSV